MVVDNSPCELALRQRVLAGEPAEEVQCICWQQPRPLSRICMYRRTRLERARALPFLARRKAPSGTSNNSPALKGILVFIIAPPSRTRDKCAMMSLTGCEWKPRVDTTAPRKLPRKRPLRGRDGEAGAILGAITPQIDRHGISFLPLFFAPF